MGWVRPHTSKKDRTTYTAYYRDLSGVACCAGTWLDEEKAEKAWQRAEADRDAGRIGDPKKGRTRFATYVRQTWLPHHVIEDSTRQTYVSQIDKHLVSWFGQMRMRDVLPIHVREWVTYLGTQGLKRKTVKNIFNTLSAIFTTAFNDKVTSLHPCKGVKTKPAPEEELQIITPEQFDDIYAKLPNSDMQLLVETDIESGARWGELTEFRVKDLNTKTRIWTIRRTVVQLSPKFHPEGQRFLVKEYPKGRKRRRVKLAKHVVAKLVAHIKAKNLGPEDLLFRLDPIVSTPRIRAVPNPDELGLTDPNSHGRQYKHGTMSGYNAGRCRCRHCKDAAAIYRASRRSQGLDEPRQPRIVQTDEDGHIPSDWFRRNIWYKAVEAASIGFKVRPHDLRHAHASWLLAGGADLVVVKSRLGHVSIATTEKYLHTLPDADETALDALAATQNRSRLPDVTPTASQQTDSGEELPTTPEEILAQMTLLQTQLTKIVVE